VGDIEEDTLFVQPVDSLASQHGQTGVAVLTATVAQRVPAIVGEVDHPDAEFRNGINPREIVPDPVTALKTEDDTGAFSIDCQVDIIRGLDEILVVVICPYPFANIGDPSDGLLEVECRATNGKIAHVDSCIGESVAIVRVDEVIGVGDKTVDDSGSAMQSGCAGFFGIA